MGTLRALSLVLVKISALAVIPGRRVRGGSTMLILISNSVFWSVLPAPALLALLAISATTPVSTWSRSASTSISACWPIVMEMMSFSSTLTWVSISERSAMTRMTSSWNWEPMAISPCSLRRSLMVPDMGA